MARRALLAVALCGAAAAAPAPLPAAVVAARAEAAILGGFVADAAAMPLHWIYDVNEIAKLVG